MQIGSLQLDNPLILAPMAGITDLPYRLIMKRFGASLVFTEMISANGLFFNGEATRALLRSDQTERPLGVQLFGEEPDRLADATRMVEPLADVIDLNLGCPVKKVVRSGAGSALLRDLDKVSRILAAVRKATRLPLTIKIRSGWDTDAINYLEVARIAVKEGIDAITLHPRTRSQMFGGKADWSQIMRLKEQVSIPVIGSGDLFNPGDIKTMFEQTGCDAVMLARGCYGNPWLFRQALDSLSGKAYKEPTETERYQIARDHLQLCMTTFDHRKALGLMRKHLCWYVRGLENSAQFRVAVNQARTCSELQGLLEEFFADAA